MGGSGGGGQGSISVWELARGCSAALRAREEALEQTQMVYIIAAALTAVSWATIGGAGPVGGGSDAPSTRCPICHTLALCSVLPGWLE